MAEQTIDWDLDPRRPLSRAEFKAMTVTFAVGLVLGLAAVGLRNAYVSLAGLIVIGVGLTRGAVLALGRWRRKTWLVRISSALMLLSGLLFSALAIILAVLFVAPLLRR